MKSKWTVWSGLLIGAIPVLVCPVEAASGLDALVAPGAEVELLADDFRFTEGPAEDRDGNVFFTDQPNDRILKWSVEGELTTWMQPCGRSNGMYFDHDGDLITCADEKNQLWSIAPDKTVTVLVKEYRGKRLNGPNDLWIDPRGGIYFTDPYYQRPWWDRQEGEQGGEHVYYLDPDRKSLERIATGFVRPNGIIGTPDGKKLYIADIGDRKTYVFDINLEEGLVNRRLFCELGSDGMTIDDHGNVYLTGRGVTVFSSEGDKIGNIPIDEDWTANVCFGGPGHDALFITAMDSLYRLKMQVHGVRWP